MPRAQVVNLSKDDLRVPTPLTLRKPTQRERELGADLADCVVVIGPEPSIWHRAGAGSLLRRYTFGMDARLNSARSLGEWVREGLDSPEPNADHIVRVIARETDRWFKNNQTDEQILALTQEPARTGDPRWNALIEGVVARKLNAHQLKRPEWTRATHLEEGWAPRGNLVRDVRWHIIDVFSTPVELLDKGVILPSTDLDLV